MIGYEREIEAEARLGLAPALRSIAMAGGDRAEASLRWTLRSDPELRREIARADRVVCALLCGDALAAARELETAGPLGAPLACLRLAVHAQRTHAGEQIPDADAEIATTAAAYLRDLTLQVAVPADDAWVWQTGLADAAPLAERLVLHPLPSERPHGPLALIAAAMADRALLYRRAYTVVFAGYGAGLLHIAGTRHGRAPIDSARQWAALTIAYTEGRDVRVREGRLHIEEREAP